MRDIGRLEQHEDWLRPQRTGQTVGRAHHGGRGNAHRSRVISPSVGQCAAGRFGRSVVTSQHATWIVTTVQCHKWRRQVCRIGRVGYENPHRCACLANTQGSRNAEGRTHRQLWHIPITIQLNRPLTISWPTRCGRLVDTRHAERAGTPAGSGETLPGLLWWPESRCGRQPPLQARRAWSPSPAGRR